MNIRGEREDRLFSPYLQRAPFAGESTCARQTMQRIDRLCRRAVDAMSIDLRGMRVLTEAATGPFAVTPVIASLAGAEEVRAVTRDSRWGPADEAIEMVRALARHCGVAGRITFSIASPETVSEGCDLVTNLGFLRPIGRSIASRLSAVAAVSLMWEPWEFRAEDIDMAALDEHGVALVATNEHHPEVRTFEYLGPTLGRMLLEIGIEIANCRLAVIGSDPFGTAIADWLIAAGAEVFTGRPQVEAACALDALVIAEHRDHAVQLGHQDQPLLAEIAKSGAPVVRLCGAVESDALLKAGVALYPPIDVSPGVMSLTTAYAGPRPVIDLHAAGLKAAGEVVKARREGATLSAAIAASVHSGYGLAVDR